MSIKKLNNKSGFSLLELIVVIGILAVVITGMMHLFVYASALSEMSANKSAAMATAFMKMEELRNYEFGSISTDYASGGTPGNSFTSTLSNNAVGMIFLSTVEGSTDILEVRIGISWQDQNGRVIGEDANLNGVFEIAEDVNGNSQYDSPAVLVSYIARRY